MGAHKTEMNIHICHYTPLHERKSFFKEQIERLSLQLQPNFIQDYDREVMTNTHRDKFSKIADAERSLFLKHMKCLENIQSHEEDFGIIMEDDCIFRDDFSTHLDKILKNMPVGFDILYTGVFPFYKQNPNPVPLDRISDKLFYDMKDVQVFPWTGNNKGTDFYIVSKKMCRCLIDTFNSTAQISIPIDHWLGQVCYNMKCNVFWYREEFTIHGSWGDGNGVNAAFSNSLNKFR
jgi:GR25 family glycosyltransferase involved in LPS biosynthesis